MNDKLQSKMRKRGLLFVVIVVVMITLASILCRLAASFIFEEFDSDIIVIPMIITAIAFTPFAYYMGKEDFLMREKVKKQEESRKLVDEHVNSDEPVEIIPIDKNGKEITMWTTSMKFYAKLENSVVTSTTHLCVYSVLSKNGEELGHETLKKTEFTEYFKFKEF